MSMWNSSDTVGNGTLGLPTFSAVPQPTAPPRAPREGPSGGRISELTEWVLTCRCKILQTSLCELLNKTVTYQGSRFLGSNLEEAGSVHCDGKGKGKGKAVPLQAWSGPEGARKLRFPDYMTTAQDGGKVVSLRQPAVFTLRKCSWYSFLLEAESTPGP
jgi:hypothetical protein